LVHSGKEEHKFMENIVFAHLGLPSGRVKIGPGTGLDNGVISIGAGRVLILTTDPISAIPAFGMEFSAWLSVHLIASDYTTSGADPEFALFSYNFPESMSRGEREEYIRSVSDECKKLGVAIAGGHTGSYPGSGFTVIGTGSMLGIASDGGYVAPSMARVGDSIVMTKHAAMEATASLASSFPVFTDAKVGTALGEKARALARLCSTVEDARIARKVGLGPGYVSSMHDATEGGVMGALLEMAAASAKSFVVDPDSVPVPPESKRVCEAFGIDPLATMGEGALLITCSPSRVPELLRTMRRAKIATAVIGRVKEGKGLWLEGGNRPPRKFEVHTDAYWSAYDRAVQHRLK
jgi:hydrogenase maturation factor